jgi:hypothetical protein
VYQHHTLPTVKNALKSSLIRDVPPSHAHDYEGGTDPLSHPSLVSLFLLVVVTILSSIQSLHYISYKKKISKLGANGQQGNGTYEDGCKFVLNWNRFN